MRLTRFLVIAGVLLICCPSLAEESSLTAVRPGMDDFILGGRHYALLTMKDPNQWTVEFNKAASRHGMFGTISNCELLIDVPAGVKDGNHSYGAYCELRQEDQKQTIAICNDIMIDHLQYSIAADVSDKKSLAAFVIANCIGG